MSEVKLRCVVVGDGSVGKTCLLIRYVRDDYPTEYLPTIFDNFAVTIPAGEVNYELHLFDTAGQEEYDEVRKLAFVDADVFLVCFSVDLPSSYANVRDVKVKCKNYAQWIPELQRLCPDVPFLLIGTKIDLRYHQDTIRPISNAQGEDLAKELKAAKYIECSALTKENVAQVFQEAVDLAICSKIPKDNSPKEDGSKCCCRATHQCVIF